jgi:hypothetical protein
MGKLIVVAALIGIMAVAAATDSCSPEVRRSVRRPRYDW